MNNFLFFEKYTKFLALHTETFSNFTVISTLKESFIVLTLFVFVCRAGWFLFSARKPTHSPFIKISDWRTNVIHTAVHMYDRLNERDKHNFVGFLFACKQRWATWLQYVGINDERDHMYAMAQCYDTSKFTSYTYTNSQNIWWDNMRTHINHIYTDELLALENAFSHFK